MGEGENGREGEGEWERGRMGGDSYQLPIPNSQFPIPNSPFPITSYSQRNLADKLLVSPN